MIWRFVSPSAGLRYGQVYRGVWKGTEVAIKVIASENATKELEKSFRDEARLHRYLLSISTIGPGSNICLSCVSCRAVARVRVRVRWHRYVGRFG